MTAVETPTRSLYHSPRGLYDFQAEHVVLCVLRRFNLVVWDTGLGKTHAGLATSALLFEDDAIDHVLLVCEQVKIEEWVKDFATFTDIDTVAYVGTPDRRAKIRNGTLGLRKKAGVVPDPKPLPRVLIGSFETFKADLVVPRAADSRQFEDGPLLTQLSDKRVLVIWDETTKLANRQSATHRAHKHAIDHWREKGTARAMALTATPMERNLESYYNLGRIMSPETMPTVKDFLANYVSTVDFRGEPKTFRNLDDFAVRFRNVMLRKRKTDPDVRDQFPEVTEDFRYIPLSPEHMEFYRRVEDMVADMDDPVVEQSAFSTLRQLAGYPPALLGSEGVLAQAIVATLGAEGLNKLGAAKLDRLVADLRVIRDQGARAIVFSHYPSIIEPMAEELKAAGLRVVKFHGRMTPKEKERSKERFQAGEADVFFASMSGERGINLPGAGYVINYDLPTKHSAYVQRLNRASRIGSGAGEILTVRSYIAAGTVEVGLSNLWLNRNRDQDELIDADVASDDETFVSAEDRRRILRAAAKETP